MTSPARVIYLPPGVTPTPQVPAPVPVSNIPFDRNFFEKVLPQAIHNFCAQVECDGLPVVEVLTVDGTTHYVNGISGVSDVWVALHTTQMDHDHPIQVFVPYQTIFRVGIHPGDEPTRRRLGFVVEAHRPEAVKEHQQPAPPAEPQKEAQPAAEPAAADGEGQLPE